ncbi:MAG: hypothetical protein MKZ89_12425, partial [Nisaea sp.]|nr:hypothetical protein [Nisaea sp.]
KNTSANALRKKTISSVCSVSEDNRIKIPIVAKNAIAIVIQTAALKDTLDAVFASQKIIILREILW